MAEIHLSAVTLIAAVEIGANAPSCPSNDVVDAFGRSVQRFLQRGGMDRCIDSCDTEHFARLNACLAT
jgi:hypothetical protein